MHRFLLFPCILISLLLPGGLPATAQTKPKVQVPTQTRPEARAIVQELLKSGRIIRTSQVKRGMRGVGRSVFQGTHIEEFPIVVLGVLQRVQGGGDVVLIKILGGTVIQRQSGVIAGMSGSPVYINGKMLGAISLGWGFPREPIAGVTPITEMIETTLPDPNRKKIVTPSGKTIPATTSTPTASIATPRTATPRTASKAQPANVVYRPQTPLRVAGRDIARVVVSRDRRRLALSGPDEAATMTLRPATTLLQMSGFSSNSLPRLRRIFEPYGIEPMIGPASKKSGVRPPLIPGAAVGVQLVSGDMDQTAVGTITFRWGHRVLAFGHPMFGMGAVSLPIASAYVHEIFPSYQRSFKLASAVRVEGALQQDTQFAIGGTIGMTADTIPMTVSLRDPARSIARKYKVRVMKDPVLTPQLIGIVATEAIETTLGLASDKMVRVDMRMNIDGAAPIVRHNYLYANNIVTMAALADLAQTLDLTQMNEFARGSIRSVDLRVAVETERKTATIKRLVANRNKVKAGQSIQVTVGLEPSDTPGKVIPYTFDFTVPPDTPSGTLRIAAGASVDFWPLQVRVGGVPPQPTNLPELIAAWNKVGSFNELMVQASTTRNFLQVDQQKITNPAPSWSKLMRAVRSTNIGSYNEVEIRRIVTPFSLSGAQFLTIPVESIRHPDKGAPSIIPAAPEKEDNSTPEAKPTPSAPPPDDDGDGDGNDDGDGDSASTVPKSAWRGAARGDWIALKSSFLQQLKTWQPLKDKVPPPREKPEPPITPSITSATPSPTSAPTPSGTPTPAPSPTPTPTPDSKILARPALSWVQEGTADFLRGDFNGSFVTNEGQVHRAPPAHQIATTDQPFVWSVAADAKGNTYLGTGNDGRIIRVDANGKQSTFYDGPEVAVTALTTDSAGNLYAGLSPGGRVYRFSPAGKRTTIFDSHQTFIWALEWDDKGRLLIGTGGDQGILYRLNDPATLPHMDNQSTRYGNHANYFALATVPQKHVRAIAVRGSDIFVGTGDEGVLYRIDAASTEAKGGEAKNIEATALFQTGEGAGRRVAESEILAVAAAPEGVYFGTSSSGTLYRWDEHGGVTEIYPSPQQAIYALRRTSDGKLYAATGEQGVVYQVQPGANANDTRAARLVEPTQQQALALALAPSGDLLIGTGNNGAAYRVALQDKPTGTFTSNVFDAKNVVLWGALRVLGHGAVIETRSGNTVDPDASWSGWKPPVTNDLGEQQVASPPARYLQYRILLSDGAGADTAQEPQLARIEVVYRTRNSAPSVTIDTPRGGEFWNGKKKLKWSGKDPDNDSLRYRVWLSADEGKTWQPLDTEDPEAAVLDLDTTKWKDGVYRIKVETSDAMSNPEDAQRDEAVSRPFVVDNTAPHLEAAGSSPTVGTDASAVRLQVTAVDALSPLTAAEWHLVRSTPATTPLTGSTPPPGPTGPPGPPGPLVPESSGKTGITPAVPSKPTVADDWHAAAAADGIFDSRRETITALVTALVTPAVSGAPTVEVRVHDAAGNTASIVVPLPQK